jgi:hypothetical protein
MANKPDDVQMFTIEYCVAFSSGRELPITFERNSDEMIQITTKKSKSNQNSVTSKNSIIKVRELIAQMNVNGKGNKIDYDNSSEIL